MLVALSDTHGRRSHRLEGRTLEAVHEAEVVVHAGDFTTEAVFESFAAICDVRGVTGNNDPPALCDRLPEERIVEWEGLRIAVVHGHDHSEMGLVMFGRESNADLVVFGHSHRPEIRNGEVLAVNPGSHADPRWHRPAHAELTVDGAVVRGELLEPSGKTVETFTLTRG